MWFECGGPSENTHWDVAHSFGSGMWLIALALGEIEIGHWPGLWLIALGVVEDLGMWLITLTENRDVAHSFGRDSSFGGDIMWFECGGPSENTYWPGMHSFGRDILWFECGGPSENTYWPGMWLIALGEISVVRVWRT